MKTWRTLWLFPEPPATALELAVHDLQEAQVMRLQQARIREHACAMEIMLEQRIERLQQDIKALAADEKIDSSKLFIS